MDDNDNNSDAQMEDISTIFGVKSPSRNVPSQISLFGKNSPLPRSRLDDMLINLDSPAKTGRSHPQSQSLPPPRRPQFSPLPSTHEHITDDEDNMELTSVFQGSKLKNGSRENTLNGMEITKGLNSEANGMEMTNVVGKGLNRYSHINEITKTFGQTFREDNADITDGMEFTQAVGKLRNENDDTSVMESTRVVGGIINRENPNESMEFTQAVGRNLDDDTSVMESTRVVRGIINRENPNESMEFTQAVGRNLDDDTSVMESTRVVGGIINQDNPNESMDFTQAVGKLQTHDAPVISQDNPDESGMEFTQAVGVFRNQDDDTLVMESTRVVGGIVNRDPNESMEFTQAVGVFRNQDDDTSAMESTRVVGGIVNRDPNESMEFTQAVGRNLDDDTSVMDSTRVVGGIINREINESMEMTTAVGRVRSTIDEDMTMESTRVMGGILSKRFEADISMEITKPLGTPWKNMHALQPAVPSTPMKLLKQQIVSMSPEKPKPKPLLLQESLKNPPLSPVMSNDNISLNEFLSMISIDFMDKFLSNSRGHSSFGISDSPVEEAAEEDYFIAAQKLPLLNMYDFGAHELKNDIKKAKEYFTQWEESVIEENPVLFQEFVDASPETKQIMKSQFLLLKNFSRQQAKGAWYDWRGQLTSGLNKDLEKNKALLDEDLQSLHKTRTEVEEVNSKAQKKHDELRKSIEELKKRNSELANCDKENLFNLRDKIEALKIRITETQTSLSSSKQQQQSVQGSNETLRLEKQKIHEQIHESEVIRERNRIIENQEIALLHKQYEFLSTSLGISNCSFHDNNLEISFKSELFVCLDLTNGTVSTRYKGDSTVLQFLHRHLQGNITQMQEEKQSAKSIIIQANEMWNNSVLFKKAIDLLQLQFMTSVSIDDDLLCLAVELLLEDKKGAHRPPCQLSLKIRLDPKSIVSYPRCYGSTVIGVVFGNAGDAELLEQIHEGISASLESKGIAGLSQICLQILEDFKS